MAIQNTLQYLLLSEYLNPNTLTKLEKNQGKNKITFEIKIDNFDKKFWENFLLLQRLDKLNYIGKNGENKTLKIEIFGGIFQTSQIENRIYEIAPKYKNNDFRQESLEIAA
nr:hypothetical protein [Campylobacter sp.]